MIPALIGILTPIISKVLDKIPNPAEREKARLEIEVQLQAQQLEIMKLFSATDAGQVEINKIEASSEDKFKSYWRPALAWVLVAAYGWAYLLHPIVTFIFTASGKPLPPLPEFSLGEMTPVLMGVLGLGAMRSFEKVKSITK